MARGRSCATLAAEDKAALYALGRAGWSIVESRLHYYRTNLADLADLAEPAVAVRAAAEADAEQVRRVAAENRNPFDRFHADPVFSSAQADSFLGEYGAAAVRGFCDVVLVPANEPLDSFLAVSHLEEDAQRLGVKMGRVVLTAAGAANRGWHRKLMAETVRYTHNRGGELVLMTTQVTNRAVIHNSEVLGFKLGGITHIASCRLL